MAQFLFLLRGGNPDLKNYSPEDLQKLLERYETWIDQLKELRAFVDAQKLIDEGGRVVTSVNGRVVVQGPFAETKETLTGYFLIEARDYAEAVNLAKQCPVLDHGGEVEVREVAEDCAKRKD